MSNTKQGALSPYLLQPLHPVWRYATEHWGEMLCRLPVVLPLVLLGLTLADAWTISLLSNLPIFLLPWCWPGSSILPFTWWWG